MQISGIEIEKNTKGESVFIRIDLQKYGKQLQPFLEEIGLLEDDFEKEWENALTREELTKRIDKHISSLPWKKQ